MSNIDELLKVMLAVGAMSTEQRGKLFNMLLNQSPEEIASLIYKIDFNNSVANKESILNSNQEGIRLSDQAANSGLVRERWEKYFTKKSLREIAETALYNRAVAIKRLRTISPAITLAEGQRFCDLLKTHPPSRMLEDILADE